jgi:hypothetical protein
MTISLAVVLLECTGYYQLGLPLMLTLLTARLVGNSLNTGIHDAHIALRGWPLLEESVDEVAGSLLRAHDVMVPRPIVLAEVETAGRILDVLLLTRHCGFPVVHVAGAHEGRSGWARWLGHRPPPSPPPPRSPWRDFRI